jgi:hypothetical protein
MTIEFWPRRCRTPKPAPKPKKPRRRWPKLPVKVGKARQMLNAAIICGDHEQASWIDAAVKRGQVVGKHSAICELRKRLDSVMEPLAKDDSSSSPQS